MKRFLLFGGDNYYPGGGAEDYRGAFNTLEEAQASTGAWDWRHVAEISSDGLKIISTFRSYQAKTDQWVTAWQSPDWSPPDLDDEY